MGIEALIVWAQLTATEIFKDAVVETFLPFEIEKCDETVAKNLPNDRGRIVHFRT